MKKKLNLSSKKQKIGIVSCADLEKNEDKPRPRLFSIEYDNKIEYSDFP